MAKHISWFTSAIAYCFVVAAADGECLPGKYAGTASSEGQDPFPVLLTVACETGAPTGQLESPFGDAPLPHGETSADHWRFEGKFDGQPLELDATLSSGLWRGTYRHGPSGGQLLLRRDDAATFAALNADESPRLDLSVDAWRSDLATLAKEVPARHANAFHTVTESQWKDAIAALDARLPTLSGMEVPVAFRELVARIGDGHTSIRLPETRRLPVGLFWFDRELRIVETSGDHTELLGARVLSFGDRQATDTEDRASRLTARENNWARLAVTPYLLRREDVLTYLELATAGQPARLRVRLANGQTTDVQLPFEDAAKAPMTGFVSGQAPIWRQRPDESMWWQVLPGDIFYVNFRSYDQFRTRSADLIAELERRRPVHVVVDMRDNEGGDFTVFRETLLAAIRERPWLNRSDRLYVIIGREMFSAAMTNAADLHLQTNATLVGEPIGERPNSYQEVRWFSLPNSRLRVGVSTQYYEALPGAGDPDAVEPDILTPPTWGPFSAGKDDALEWIRQQGR